MFYWDRKSLECLSGLHTCLPVPYVSPPWKDNTTNHTNLSLLNPNLKRNFCWSRVVNKNTSLTWCSIGCHEMVIYSLFNYCNINIVLKQIIKMTKYIYTHTFTKYKCGDKKHRTRVINHCAWKTFQKKKMILYIFVQK